LSAQPALREGRRPSRANDATRARQAVEHHLWIPFWPELSQADRAYVADTIAGFFDRGPGGDWQR